MRSETVEVRVIGIVHSCYKEKFGIPRQSGLVEKGGAVIELLPPYNRREMVKGLDLFSHIWVHFCFHQTVKDGWKPTVRPPGLGGQERVGVFASRSPHRPNHLGISAVRLHRIELNDDRSCLHISGGDFLDGTPVIDVKPYVPYSDALKNAEGGYSGRYAAAPEISFRKDVLKFLEKYEKQTGRELKELIVQVLTQDPRPASQREQEKTFGMLLWDVNIRWHAQGERFEVLECRYSSVKEKEGG